MKVKAIPKSDYFWIGLKFLTLAQLLVAMCFLANGCYVLSELGNGGSLPSPSPAPSPAPNVPTPVPDQWGFATTLPPIFNGKPELAANTAAVCRSFSDRVEFDGKQAEPRIVSSTDVATLFAAVMSYDLLGGDPALGPFADELDRVLRDELEPDGEAVDLSRDDRRKVSQIFRAAAQSLRGQ